MSTELPTVPTHTVLTNTDPDRYPGLPTGAMDFWKDQFKLPDRKPLSKWAEENLNLSPEYAARSGELRLFGWQREIFDAFTDPRVQEIVLCVGTQLVKCLDVMTPIPTPFGWRYIGDLAVGDTVFDESGNPTRVLAVSPYFRGRQCYKLKFDDGSELVSDGQHRWEVIDRRKNGKRVVMTTEELIEGMAVPPASGNLNASRYRIDVAGPLNLPDSDLPIDPYVFGCWLGDGHSITSNITTDLRDGILDELRAAGIECRIVSVDQRRPHVAKLHLGPKYGNGTKHRDTLQGKLQELNVIGDKHIPKIYLRSSIEQRKALLQGILDTDGTVASNGSAVCLILTCRMLAVHTCELIRSLGFKPTFKEGRSSLNGRDCGPLFKIYFTAYAEDQVFRLARKRMRLRSSADPKSRPTESRRRSILSIEPVDSRPVRCIAVDSPNHLFLAGKAMIPTHNTLFIQAAIAYVIAEDPGPILLVEPKEPDAKAFSKERLTPMLRDCTVLHGRVADSAHDGNTLLMKEFPGGSLSLVGAIAPGNLARRSVRYLFCDEVDKYPASAKGEGDPISLAWERAATYQSRRKAIYCCSPTVQGLSRIHNLYLTSDQRRPYVPCPLCGELQKLKFSRDAAGGVYFDSSLSHELSPRTAAYECAFCHGRWTDLQRKQACEKAVWRAERPFSSRAGFWISHLYSPWKSLSDIVGKFLNDKSDRNLLKTFVNTNLAEVWTDEVETPDHQKLYNRREPYPFGDTAVVPKRGLFLTASVDVQESPPRLEVEVVAWGRGRENWSVDYRVIQVFAENQQPLPVTSPELWEVLDKEVLQKSYLHESGHTLPISVMTIDTGSRPKPVYEFARRHPQLAYLATGIRLHSVRTVVPIKGNDDADRVITAVTKEDAARKSQGVRILSIGTYFVKGELYDALNHIQPKPDGTLSGLPSPGCYHFPQYEYAYFQGLTAELRVTDQHGKIDYKVIYTRNEPLDLKVYNRAAATIVGIDRFNEEQWRKLEAQFLRPLLTAGNLDLIQERISGPGGDRPVVTSSDTPINRTSVTPPSTQTPVDSDVNSQSLSPDKPPIRPVRGRFW